MEYTLNMKLVIAGTVNSGVGLMQDFFAKLFPSIEILVQHPTKIDKNSDYIIYLLHEETLKYLQDICDDTIVDNIVFWNAKNKINRKTVETLLPELQDSVRFSWWTQAMKLQKFCFQNDRMPKRTIKNTLEHELASWVNEQRKKRYQLTVNEKKFLENIFEFGWNQTTEISQPDVYKAFLQKNFFTDFSDPLLTNLYKKNLLVSENDTISLKTFVAIMQKLDDSINVFCDSVFLKQKFPNLTYVEDIHASEFVIMQAFTTEMFSNITQPCIVKCDINFFIAEQPKILETFDYIVHADERSIQGNPTE